MTRHTSSSLVAPSDLRRSWYTCAHCGQPSTKDRPLTEYVIADSVDGSRNKRTAQQFHPSCIAEADKALLDGFGWVAR